MALTKFSRLNGNATMITEAELLASLGKKRKKFQNQWLEPDSTVTSLKGVKYEGLEFSNFSFSKTTISRATFTNCTFRDCLFIGTRIEDVEFHKCRFENCNFNKAKL